MTSNTSAAPATVGPACVAPDCPRPAAADAPLPLCDRHFDIAAEWSARTEGVTDTLPSPCLACGSRLGVRYPSGWLCAVCEWRYGEVPDGELPTPRVDVVYYIRFDDRIKIGTSSNPRQRLTQIWHDAVLAFERGGRDVEQKRHAEFAADRFDRTEWFRPSDALAEHIAVVGAAGPDPWGLYARWVSEAMALRT